MALIKKISIKNFRGFRDLISVELNRSTYLIGANNVGKTNILYALKAFFDDSFFIDESFLNKTEFIGKKEKYNQSEISLFFDLRKLTTKNRKILLIKNYGNILEIKKRITYTPKSRGISIKWFVKGEEYMKETLPENVQWLLSKIKVTYIHPQEGQNLFNNVQKRLRQRLLQNWGRNAAITHNINELQGKWSDVRTAANRYLSKALSDSLQPFWPGCQVQIDLPKDIAEVIDVSDISFQGEKALPEIQLTSQGTGAQSTVLYLAQYLLDSDRSLNKGEYHPVWLMEEPESFLHADLIFKIANQINSEAWLKNIQMVISTHSPILLAASRVCKDQVTWNVFKGLGKSKIIAPDSIDDDGIEEIGKLMGDQNFKVYFLAAQSAEPVIFIEDAKKLTAKKYIEADIAITRGLGGVSEIAKYLAVYTACPAAVNAKMFFIVDGDKGKDELSRFFDESKAIKEKNNIKKFKVKGVDDIFIVLLPDSLSIEDMFIEFDNHLEECVSKLWDMKTWQQKESFPRDLFRTCGVIRKRNISSSEEAKNMIKKTDDVKDLFWAKVERYNFNINPEFATALKELLK